MSSKLRVRGNRLAIIAQIERDAARRAQEQSAESQGSQPMQIDPDDNDSDDPDDGGALLGVDDIADFATVCTFNALFVISLPTCHRSTCLPLHLVSEILTSCTRDFGSLYSGSHFPP